MNYAKKCSLAVTDPPGILHGSHRSPYQTENEIKLTLMDNKCVVELQHMLHLDLIDLLVLALKARVARLFK